MPSRVLIVDDHQVFREGLKALLLGRGLEVAGEARDGIEAQNLARKLAPDIAIVDIGLPRLNGLDLVRSLTRDCPDTRCIVLTMHSEDAYVLDALKAGAQGYILKSQAFSDLTKAIDSVMAGAVYLSPGVSRAVVDATLSNSHDGAVRDPLTARERGVLQLVAEGRTNKEIGDLLCISIKTVETHRGTLMRKLDLHDTASLTRYAIRRGLIEP